MRKKENVRVGDEMAQTEEEDGEVNHHKCTHDSLARLQPTQLGVNRTPTFRRHHTCGLGALPYRARMA